MDHAEYERRRNALYEVVERDLSAPRHAAYRYIDSVVRASMGELRDFCMGLENHDFRAIKKKLEREKVDEIKKLARKLAYSVRSLHWSVKDKIAEESILDTLRINDEWFELECKRAPLHIRTSLREDDERQQEEFWLQFWKTICTFDQTIDRITPAVNAFIDDAPNDAGQRDWPSVMVVDGLRGLWEHLTKTEAPRSINTGPFSDFIVDAFAALELSSPRSAMQSWAQFDEFRTGAQKSD
jgi:hypothetical protein